MQLYGLFSISEQQYIQQYKPIILQNVKVLANVIDMISEVTIHQTYKYIESNQIQAVYKFPILNSSTICNFEAKIDDERKIKGIVKEVDQATKEYEEAIKEGNVALTIDDQLPDVFQCFIGTISSGQTIEIKLTYVSELRQNTESEGIRFILPTAIAQKYNYYSLEKNSEVDFENNHLSEFDSENCKIEISVTCRMTEVITSVESPTHSTKSALNVGDAKLTKVELNEKISYLEKDFVLVFSSQGLDKPRAFVEYNPKTGTNCAMLTLVPQCIPYIGQSEFIFIIDVSLDSQTLSHILKALELALYSLPEDSLFNVISQNSSLFPEKSQKYSQSTFTTALEFVQNISQQNIFNEFNLYSTLESIFNALTNNSTKIFYLTNSYSITKQYEQIKELFHNQKMVNENFNFFTLFVGDENSNNDIYNYFDLLTKLGRGYSTFTNFNDKFEKKLISIIKNSLEIPLSNYEINWIEDVGDTELLDYSDEKEIIVLDNEEGYNGYDVDDDDDDDDDDVDDVDDDDDDNEDKIEESDKVRSQLDESTYLAPNLSHDNNNQQPKILQAPSAIPLIYNKHNAIVYALLTKGIKPSKTLHIKAQSQQGLVQFNVPLDSHVLKGKIIHTLAAKKFIDFEENNLNNFKGKSVDSDSKVKDKIISLGKTYNLISTYTSFLAINKWSEIFSSKTPSDINNTPISIYHNYKPNNNSFAYFKDFTKRIFSPSYTPSTVSSELCNLSINSNCILSRYTGNFTYYTSNLLTNPVTFIKNGIDEVIDRYSYETLTLGIKHKHPIYYLGNGLVMYGSVVYKIVRKFEQFPVFGGLFVRPVVRFIDESILNNMRSLGRTRLELEELSPEEFDKHFRENIFESHEGMINPIIVHVETLFNFLKLFSFDGKILDEIKFYEFFGKDKNQIKLNDDDDGDNDDDKVDNNNEEIEKECLLIAISLAYFEIILWKEFKEESIMFYNKSERSLKKMIKIKEEDDLDLDEKYNELLGKARKLINNWFD